MTGKEIRVWMDGSFDMLHCGHAVAIQQAKEYGDILVVGIQPNTDIVVHKGPPVFTESERHRLLSGIKWVNQVVDHAPYGTTTAILDEHKCDFCVHGDDAPILTNPDDILWKLHAVHRLRFAKRIGTSTTKIIQRILDRSLQSTSDGEVQSNGSAQQTVSAGESQESEFESSHFLITSSTMAKFSNQKSPQAGDTVVYVAGAFDIFHTGHLDFLEKAAALGDFLLVGVHSDRVVKWRKGPVQPLLSLQDRVLRVLATKSVSDVVMGAPYAITQDFMDCYKIKLVCHGETPVKATDGGRDPFEVPTRLGKFQEIVSGNSTRTNDIISRVVERREDYERRNKKKQASEERANGDRYPAADVRN
ncbi:ethanolamine-phosphate cytidylyltransferase [Aplysia californica]|uniref:ethanolamine-phosphate cytidylyltransferase n=1 Tax=Aplysia californica TaxID=6500 RepID=A0ABM1A2E0_APLCA|nr:ethanolamine-phosphate cytidylyltransferase [Aplysia californica]